MSLIHVGVCITKAVVCEPIWFKKGIDVGNFDLNWVWFLVVYHCYYSSFDRYVERV